MAAFVVILLIVGHRFLRLDLTNDLVAALHPPALLTGLLLIAVAVGLVRGTARLRPNLPIVIQWALWGWAAISKMVSDGTGVLAEYARHDYTKDVIFASLVSTLCDSLRKLRTLSWVFVAAMTFISLVALPQRNGDFKCYHYNLADVINYVQETDNRPCASVNDCYDVPPGEEHLREAGWACEREWPWGLATVLERIHYVGSLADPNALSQALVMACALGLGLLFWPAPPLPNEERSRRDTLRRLLLVAALLIMAVAVVYAASRAAQAALAVTLLCFFYSRVGLGGAMLAGLAGLPLVLISHRNAAEAAYSTLTRTEAQIIGYMAFIEQPVFGVGFGNYEKWSPLTAHNSFVLSATETGVIGGALFFLAVYVSFKFLVQVIRWPDPGPAGDTETETEIETEEELLQQHEMDELRHMAKTLLSMLVGVGLCITFLSLSYDVMWLFPVGVVAAFYNAVKDQLPDFHFRLSLWELGLVVLAGGLLPAVFVVIATKTW